MKHALLALWTGLIACSVATTGFGIGNIDRPPPLNLVRPPGLEPNDIAVITNSNDPLSVEIGKYYVSRRNIPPQNVIEVKFSPANPIMSRVEFARVWRDVESRLRPGVEVFALTWTKPWRVECMAITSAFALGFDTSYCADGCKPTRSSAYFNHKTRRPYETLGMRPTMSLAAKSLADAQALIDRGVEADRSTKHGTAYLLETSDKNRSVRAAAFPDLVRGLKQVYPVQMIRGEFIEGKPDVMFYFTGLTHVPKIATNRYLPGAIADHLTSAGGVLEGGNQMSSLSWLQAGATASYGAVVEPCNFVSKFPNPGVVMAHYLHGETLIEAYWKSVSMPGQGIFIGEPLAAPFARH